MQVGIEAINLYGGLAYLEVKTLFEARAELDLSRFENLMMDKKSVALPCEDPVSYGVNAAKPIIDSLSEDEKNRIEMIITSSESGLDFGKSLSTYIHDYLGLKRTCRLFEIKQACYGGTAALQMAVNFVASRVSPGAKVLVVSTDLARTLEKTYAEPTQGVGATAMLVSDKPYIMAMDFGATGYYSYEVMDTCRPVPQLELGDSDLSLLSYLDCAENAFKEYMNKVEGADYRTTFDYLAFHTPFGGMVKGCHRKIMRNLYKMNPKDIEQDFENRVTPSLGYCRQVGNVYSATLYLALCGLIDHADVGSPKRLGMFSYGSGCSSEFYSGVITAKSKEQLGKMRLKERLEKRHNLAMAEYENVLKLSSEWTFGIENKEVDTSKYQDLYDRYVKGSGLLMLKRVRGYHREYEWV